MSVSPCPSSPPPRKSSSLGVRKVLPWGARGSGLCPFFTRGCCIYGRSCKDPHSAENLAESDIFPSPITKEKYYVAFFVDESGTVTKECLQNVLVESARPGQFTTVDIQERGFEQPGNMFKLTVSHKDNPHTRRTAKMFNSETLLVKGVELKKPAWWNRNKGRRDEGEQTTSDLRDKIRNKHFKQG